MKNSLTVKKNNFKRFLDTISQINESAIFNVKGGLLSSLVTTPDRTLFLYGELDGVESSINRNLNIPNIKRLVRVLDSIDGENLEFIIENNNIQYKSTALKFKYHLYEDGFIAAPPAGMVDKVKNFAGSSGISFEITKESLRSIIVGSAFATGSDKLYLYTEEGRLKGELTDKVKCNVDALTIDLGPLDHEISPLPFTVENIKIIETLSDKISCKITPTNNVLAVESAKEDIKLLYILTPRVL
jgi:hypothetical protein